MTEATWPYARPLVVHCVLSGPEPGKPTLYGPADVYRLQRALQQHMPVPYWFCAHVAASLALLPPAGHERAQRQVFVEPSFGRGWWAKLGLWHNGGVLALHHGLFFDLDTVIVDRLDDIVAALARLDGDTSLWLSDFYSPARPASGIIGWTPGWAVAHGAAVSKKALAIRPQDLRQYDGDQDFAARMLEGPKAGTWPTIERWQEAAPGATASYKEHVHGSRHWNARSRVKPPAVLPPGARVVCFHGKPKPGDLVNAKGHEWLRANWWTPGDAWAPADYHQV